jgi:hypothetical protein
MVGCGHGACQRFLSFVLQNSKKPLSRRESVTIDKSAESKHNEQSEWKRKETQAPRATQK